MIPSFCHLNSRWNADPNVPDVRTRVDGEDVLLQFKVNAFQFREFITEGDEGILRFKSCSQFRLGPTNDEGWYLGQCRFTGLAPEWGEFYAILGDPDSANGPEDWIVTRSATKQDQTHFLFYFRDETFECLAKSCTVEPDQANALFRTSRSIPNIGSDT
jgi:hypothetical protein